MKLRKFLVFCVYLTFPRPVVTSCIKLFNIQKNLRSTHTVFLCLALNIEQRARFAPYHLSYLFFGHVRKITKTDCSLRHVCLSISPSVWNNSAPTGGIFMKFENLSRKFKYHEDLTTITGTLHEDRYIFNHIALLSS